MIVLYIFIAILIFGAIILIHELGHFAAAKLCKIRVIEFAIGMGPKLLSWGKGETKYTLRAFPIGGFVSMDGEDNNTAQTSDDKAENIVGSDDPHSFRNKKPWQKLIVVLAGAVMNLVLGFVILIIVTASSDAIVSTTVADFYTEDAASHVSGLNAGDEILRVNGMKIYTDTDISYQFQSDEDAVFEMTVKRGSQIVTLPEVRFDTTVNEDGTRSLHIDFRVVGEKVTPLSVIEYSARNFVSVARVIWLSLADLIKGRYSVNDLSGPVGIVSAIGEVVGSAGNGIAVSQMLSNLMTFVVFLTINVGIFNLLPIPALDGSRALFIIIEAIRRKPMKPEHEAMVHFVGMVALLLLMVVVTIGDIIKLF